MKKLLLKSNTSLVFMYMNTLYQANININEGFITLYKLKKKGTESRYNAEDYVEEFINIFPLYKESIIKDVKDVEEAKKADVVRKKIKGKIKKIRKKIKK